jgi:hypothetical protein
MIKDDDDIQEYVRPWVGLTDEEFLKACQLAEAGNYLVAFQRIQQWLKEKNS